MDIRRFFYKFGPVLLGLSILMYFAYHGLSGDRGILSYWEIKETLENKEFELDSINSKKTELEEKVKRLNPKSLDLDFLEERVMKVLNFFHKDHVVVIQKPQQEEISQ